MWRALSLASALIITPIVDGHSQEVPKSPQIDTEQKPNGPLESKEKPKPNNNGTEEHSPPLEKIGAPVANEKRNENADKSAQEGTEFWPPLFGYRVKITDSLLALFTFLLFVATWLLWRATKRLVLGAEDANQRQLRAYVLVSGSEARGAIGGAGEVHLSIRNFGKTPAHHVAMWMGTSVREFPLNSEFGPPPEDFRMSRDIIGPGNPTTMVVPFGPLNDWEQRQLRSEMAAVYAFGRISYIDAFGISRHTEFRYMCKGRGLAVGRMTACEEGNSYT